MTKTAGSALVEISIGELIDKITILTIKSERIDDQGRLRNVLFGLDLLDGVRRETLVRSEELDSLERELKGVNEQIWELEDEIRDCERQLSFGEEFVRLARAIYRANDRRAEAKRRINELAGSRILEEKSYSPY